MLAKQDVERSCVVKRLENFIDECCDVACTLNVKVLNFKDKVVIRQFSCYTTVELMSHK